MAGVESLKKAEDYKPEDMDFVWGININGMIYTNQAACKIMKEQDGEGAIINFASDVALAGQPNGALYAASKGAVLSWTKTIAYEWAIRYNIRCNCVNPTMKTPMYQEYLDNLHEENRIPENNNKPELSWICRNRPHRTRWSRSAAYRSLHADNRKALRS